MKKNLKWIFNFSLQIVETLVSLLSVIVFSRFTFGKFLNKISKGQDVCFILANGPSLKKVIDDKKERRIFEEQDLFTVNLFFESKFFYEMKPKNHIIADSSFWVTPISDIYVRQNESFDKNMLSVDWDLNLFVPYHGYIDLKKRLKSNKKISLIPYNHTPVTGFRVFSNFLYKLNLGMPRPSNVLNAAIFLTINLGYKKVYIYGADHSWIKDLFIDEDGDVCCFQNHFYENEIIPHPYKVKRGTLAQGLSGLVDALESYKLLENYSNVKGTSIINRTKGSFLDVFERE